MLPDDKLFLDGVRRRFRGPVGHVVLNVGLANAGDWKIRVGRQAYSDNALFPLVRLRRQARLLILQITLRDFLKCVFARRLMPQHLRLLDAQQFSRADLFRLRDVGGVSLAASSPALRIAPTDPPSG